MGFIERVKQAPKSNRIKFVVVTALYILWTVWIGNFWLLLLVPFIFDIYISKYIPWGFWKKSKNKNVKKVMEWVDAILFALIAVYFINIFFFQNYQIPSSSLEKTLLVGDFLFVGKYNYGARVPNTPLSFPLAQHTLPILNCKSYIEWPQWSYKRLKGPGIVQRNDIVVFNFPAGDTVALNRQQEDFYSLCLNAGAELYTRMENKYPDPAAVSYDQLSALGRRAIMSNKGEYGDIVYRPVDRRENYVKRCVGLPGDSLQIKDTWLYINGVKQKNPKKMQLNYVVEVDAGSISEQNFRKLNVSVEDRRKVENGEFLRQMGFMPDSTGNFRSLFYMLPLTEEALTTLKGFRFVKDVKRLTYTNTFDTYPLYYDKDWTIDNFGPIWIPKKGTTITLTNDNYRVYERVIKNYENNTFEVRDGKFFINDVQADKYTFKMDYYWMMGDNRHNSADSRSWGFVPEDHVVGKPLFIWLSLDKDRGWFDGKIRWSRLFTGVESE